MGTKNAAIGMRLRTALKFERCKYKRFATYSQLSNTKVCELTKQTVYLLPPNINESIFVRIKNVFK